MKLFPRLTMLLFALVAVKLSHAATFTGTVRSVSGDVATVAMDGDVMPAVGARAEIFFKMAGVDEEVLVATGSALQIEHGDLRVKIEDATGTVEKGQLVRFSSSPSSTPAASSPAATVSPELATSPATSPTPAATQTSTEVARYFAEGLAKFDAHDLKGALAAFTKAIELDPTNPKPYANRASIYNSLKQSERGLADANEAIRLNPQIAISYVIRGNCYADAHQLKRALEDYDEAIRLDPKNTDAYNNRGIVYSMLGKNKIAMENFTQAIELDPAGVDALTNRARLYQAAGKTQLAKRDLARVRELKAQANLSSSAKPAPAPPERK